MCDNHLLNKYTHTTIAVTTQQRIAAKKCNMLKSLDIVSVCFYIEIVLICVNTIVLSLRSEP